AIRPIVTFGSLPNRVQIEPIAVEVFASTAPIMWRLLYYPPGSTLPITGGTWAAPNANSAVEANASGTALSLTGSIEIGGGYVPAAAAGNARASVSLSLPPEAAPLVLDAAGAGDPRTTNVGANPAYLVVSGLGASATAGAHLTWQEVR
ncbi:MAG TPA: hypothetical protein VIV12_27135, partial [Streptosporangiaceae bacterium]